MMSCRYLHVIFISDAADASDIMIYIAIRAADYQYIDAYGGHRRGAF